MNNPNQENRHQHKRRLRPRSILRIALYRKDRLRASRVFSVSLGGAFLILAGIFFSGAGVFWILLQFSPVRQAILGYEEEWLRQHLHSLMETTEALEAEVRQCEMVIQALRTALQEGTLPQPLPSPTENIPGTDSRSGSERDSQTSFPLVPPVKNGEINLPVALDLLHFGVDLRVSEGAPVYSIGEGTVVLADWTLQTGYTVIIQHPNGWLSVYRHNQKLYVSAGDFVRTGQLIARVGKTGLFSRGVHLHFELWDRGFPLDPSVWLWHSRKH